MIRKDVSVVSGHCCWYIIYKDNEPKLKKCMHLRRLNSGRTICREYKKAIQERTRHGHRIDTYWFGEERKTVFCVWRKDGQWNYEGCPFNEEGLPTFESYLENIGIKIPWRKT